MAGAIKSDRELASEVRRLGLGKIKKIFEMAPTDMSDKERELHDELLKRMGPSFVPRLTEITGADGGAIEHSLSKEDKAKLDKILGTDNKLVEEVVNAEIAEEGGEEDE